MSDQKKIEQPEKLPKYRAMRYLAYNPDLCGDERGGTVYAAPGDITELYSELRAYPTGIQHLLNLGVIEKVPDVVINRPSKEGKTSEE